MSDCFKNDVFKLGFGLMRLPKLADGKTIDVEQTKKMVDLFIEAGGTYFDTAYVYDNGESEAAIRFARNSAPGCSAKTKRARNNSFIPVLNVPARAISITICFMRFNLATTKSTTNTACGIS